MRESVASLETVERAAEDGDFVVLDFLGSVDGEPFEGGEARGYLLELGSGRLIPGFEEQLVGATADEEREVKVAFPEEYQAEHLAGKDAVFATTVREVKEKKLPELDDDFALDTAGMDSLEELREDIGKRLRDANERSIETEYREAVLDAAVDDAQVEIDHDLIHAKAHDMWHETARRLPRQGLDPAQYLQFTGKTEEELVTEAEPEAERALKREAVLAAVVEAEGIDVTDDELLDAMREANAARAARRQAAEGTPPLARRRASRAATSCCARTSRCARRSTRSSRTRSRSRSTRPRRARRSGRPTRRRKRAAPGKLWTPGS